MPTPNMVSRMTRITILNTSQNLRCRLIFFGLRRFFDGPDGGLVAVLTGVVGLAGDVDLTGALTGASGLVSFDAGFGKSAMTFFLFYFFPEQYSYNAAPTGAVPMLSLLLL